MVQVTLGQILKQSAVRMAYFSPQPGIPSETVSQTLLGDGLLLPLSPERPLRVSVPSPKVFRGLGLALPDPACPDLRSCCCSAIFPQSLQVCRRNHLCASSERVPLWGWEAVIFGSHAHTVKATEKLRFEVTSFTLPPSQTPGEGQTPK